MAGAEYSKFWSAADIDAVPFISARFVTQSFARHTHDHFVIGVNEGGVESFFCRGAERIAPAGTIVIINPGEVHTGHSAGREAWTYRGLYPEVATLRDAGMQPSSGSHRVPFFPSPVIHDPALSAMLSAMHRVLESSNERLERQSHFTCFMTTLLARHAVGHNPPRFTREKTAVEKVRCYIEDRFRESLTLYELASLVGLNPCHLLRSFRDEIGMPPHQYLLQVRVEHARQLLKKGQRISYAAAEAGFADQSHFARRFKSVYGITPGQYINALH